MKLINAFITSDLHIGSDKIAQTRGFSDWTEAWLDYKSKHNAIVSNNQTVIIAGDVCKNKIYQDFLKQLKGNLHFVLGNHDLGFNYEPYGKTHAMLLCSKLGVIITHIPVHPTYFYEHKTNWVNCHGHMHYMHVTKEDNSIDDRYINVCPDLHNNQPILINTLITLV